MPIKNTNWSSLKSKISELENKDLLKLVGELYKLTPENKRFLEARYASNAATLKEFKQEISEALCPNIIEEDSEVDFRRAKKAISTYTKANGSKAGIAELMVFYVERANQFTLDNGDMWEQFYISVENMFEKAAKQIKELQADGKNTDSLQRRLKTIVESTDCIGWGYHDTLTDLYAIAFDDE